MIHKIKFVIFLLLAWNSASAQVDSLDNGITISLVTGSPGEDLYAVFGHSAIRVRDAFTGQDILYNYGTFDFDTPNFYIKFIRGKLPYMLDVDRTADLAYYYQRVNRSLTEQILNLNNEQEARLIEFLNWNHRPENRYYLYDFFYDNCATVIRDVFEKEFNISYQPGDVRDVTFRQLLDEYLQEKPWADFGIDLILGLPADKKADIRDQMFLPDYLSSNLAKATIDGKPFMQPVELLQPRVEVINNSMIKFTPMLLFVIVALLAIIITLGKNERSKNIFDIIILSACGLAGLFFLFMWFGTDHVATKWNWNVLWLNPLCLLMVIGIIGKKGKWLRILFAIYATILWLLLLTWGLFPQQFNTAVIPILIALIARSMDREGVMLDLIKKTTRDKVQATR